MRSPSSQLTPPSNSLRNYLAHSIEGGLYMGGLAFVAPESVLPRIVESLGGPGWVISLMPVLVVVGFVLPGLLVAHLVERLERTLPVVLFMGVFQRLPFLLTGITLLWVGESLPTLALVIVALAPLVSGLAGGMTSPAWMELIAKTIDPDRRASAMAIRMIIASLIGLMSGAIIAAVLHRWPGVPGFGVLHLIAFVFMLMSLSILALVREEAVDPGHHGPALGLRQNLLAVPEVLRNAPGLRTFMGARVLTCGFYTALPFMAIHALNTTGHPDSYLGVLVSAQMGGGIAGNLLAGLAGDRRGGRGPALLGAGSLLLLCLALPFGTAWWQFVAGFVLLGFGMAIQRVGMITLGLELAPVAKRATAVASIGWFMGMGLLGSALLSGLLWTLTHRVSVLAAAASLLMGLAFLTLLRVPEPRPPAQT